MDSAPADSYPRLVGDIGGTHARFARVDVPGAAPHTIRTLRSTDFSGPAAAIAHYLDEVGGARPRWCAFGIATPMTGDVVRMTNLEWTFSIRELRRTLRLERLEVVNDFTALALALPVLTTRG